MDKTRRLLLDHMREQAVFGEALGSPFTGRLCERMASDLEAGGPVAKLVGAWQGHPRADAVAVRLAGALHAAALAGRDPALAAEYPEQRDDWDMDALWPLARAFFERERAFVADFIRSPPQTNEVRRSIALLLGFLTFASEHDGPFDTFEVGASAGLNLHWDRFGYRTSSWSWGTGSKVSIDTAWSGPPPPLAAQVRVRSRAACDLNPLDLRDPTQRTRLRAYIWADQRARLARFDAAVELALAADMRVEAADVVAFLERNLAHRPAGVGTVVYHSVFMQYLSRETLAGLQAVMESAGARASSDAPLAWLRLEPEAMLGGARSSARFLLELTTWPGQRRRVLAIADGHVTAVEALPL